MTVIHIPARLGDEVPAVADAITAALAPLTPCPLTPRELQVLRLTAAGHPRREIAATLGLSPLTVKTHLCRLYKRLGVSSAPQAVLLACRAGWLPEYLPDPAPRRAAPRYLPGRYARQPIRTVHLPTEGARA